MLHLIHSNRMERLVACLCEVLSRPLASPLEPERFVVQNTGLARWLDQQLALRFDIAGNHRFELPSSFVWSLFRLCLEQVPETSPYEKETLCWRIFERLPNDLDDPAFASLDLYLRDDTDGLKRFQLARRLADMLDQYLVYRPDWIQAWEEGGEEEAEGRWQAQLWRDLRHGIGEGHRVALQRRFLSADLSERQLPERVCVFGISALPPMSLEVLRHLARFTEVHLFVLNPSLEWWGDIVPEKGMARLRAAWRRRGLPDLSAYYDTGNPLLAAWGRLGRDFQQLLYRENVPDQREAFEEPTGDSLLQRVQQDLLTLYDRRAAPDPTPVPAEDDSLRIHACHSPLREVEVLHDQLLDLFQRHPDLAPRDVVVMTPEVDRYAPYVQAVFGSAPPQRAIPWSLADLSAAAESPLAPLVVQLLELPGGRFGASEVLGLLEIPQVQARFGIAPGDMERIRAWVRDSGIRWGLDAAGREGLGPEGDDTNTWDFGFRRLFLGYALPEGVERFGDLAPLAGVEGGEARLLGALRACVERLAGIARLFARPHVPRQWHAHLTRALDELLATGDDDPGLERVRTALGRLADGAARAGLEVPLGREVVRAWLAAELATGGAEHRYAAGRVTFCAMVPTASTSWPPIAARGTGRYGMRIDTCSWRHCCRPGSTCC
jgi:exodeoxyribonuclease V gamma subunit